MFARCVAVIVCFHALVFGQSLKPLTTEYVECVRNDKSVDVASRTVQTTIFESKEGGRAFGLVAAEVGVKGCQNTSLLYVAEPHRPFQLVFKQEAEKNPDSSVYDGNGIQAIHWSPSGKRVLAEISQWTWGSDFGWDVKYVLFALGDHVAKPISPVEVIWKQFKQPCSTLIKSNGWIDDSRVALTASPFVDTDEEGIPDTIPTCVQKTMNFSFDVDTGGVQVLPTIH